MVITAAASPTARALAAALPAGMGMFVAGYSPTGSQPATHYVSEGWIDEPFAIALESPTALVEMLLAAGSLITLAQATTLLSQATVSELSASVVLSQINLLPVV